MTTSRLLSVFGAALFIGVVTVVGVSLTAPSAATDDVSLAAVGTADAGDAAVVAVKFHADWCGPCHELARKFDQLAGRFRGEAVHFAAFDLTDARAREGAQETATALGLEQILAKYGSGTGYALLVDRTSKRVVGVISAGDAVDEMAAKLRKALAGATTPA